MIFGSDTKGSWGVRLDGSESTEYLHVKISHRHGRRSTSQPLSATGGAQPRYLATGMGLLVPECPPPARSTTMSNMNPQLARAMHAERERDFTALQRRRQAKLTRLAAKRPAPSVRRAPGLLARLVPWFGVRARPA